MDHLTFDQRTLEIQRRRDNKTILNKPCATCIVLSYIYVEWGEYQGFGAGLAVQEIIRNLIRDFSGCTVEEKIISYCVKDATRITISLPRSAQQGKEKHRIFR